MSNEDREIRKAVKKLLELCKLFQARAMSRETALKTIIQLPPDGRASLTGDDVGNLIEEAREMADEKAGQATAQLEHALESGTDWLAHLEAYTSAWLKDE